MLMWATFLPWNISKVHNYISIFIKMLRLEFSPTMSVLYGLVTLPKLISFVGKYINKRYRSSWLFRWINYSNRTRHFLLNGWRAACNFHCTVRLYKMFHLDKLHMYISLITFAMFNWDMNTKTNHYLFHFTSSGF